MTMLLLIARSVCAIVLMGAVVYFLSNVGRTCLGILMAESEEEMNFYCKKGLKDERYERYSYPSRKTRSNSNHRKVA